MLHCCTDLRHNLGWRLGLRCCWGKEDEILTAGTSPMREATATSILVSPALKLMPSVEASFGGMLLAFDLCRKFPVSVMLCVIMENLPLTRMSVCILCNEVFEKKTVVGVLEGDRRCCLLEEDAELTKVFIACSRLQQPSRAEQSLSRTR